RARDPRPMSLLRRHPWIPLAALFLGFVAVWACWLLIALRHAPESVNPVNPPSDHAPAR
ncbi:MAG: hypothetical protein RIS38_24, partial [Verrucomicrobiota bacterium]